MFRNVLRSSATTQAFVAGAAAAATGSAFWTAQSSSPAISACEEEKTVVGMLQGLSQKVSNIEAVLGSVPVKPPVKRAGIDIVLGSQWGDEGKGKLVDILSQVCGKLTILLEEEAFLRFDCV